MKKRILCLILALVVCVSLAPAAKADNAKLVAMTFDDGPNAACTPVLLDALKERGIKATFFVVGYCAAAHPELVKRAYDEGHQIANHSYNHYYFSSYSTDAFITREIQSCADLLTEITGETEFMFRLPGGNGVNNARIRNLVGAPIIMWSVDATGGKAGASEQKLYTGTVNAVRDGSIVLLHDGHNMANVNAAIRAIDTLLERGFEFVTLNELFRLRGVTPQDNVAYYSVTNSAYAVYDETYLASHWAYPYISYVMEKGVMLGDGAGFVPNGTMTRAMAVTVLWRLSGSPPPDYAAGFTDVPEDAWYTAAVNWAKENGIAEGCGESLFCPERAVTRQEFYKMLDCYAVFAKKDFSCTGDVTGYTDDVRMADWAVPYVSDLRYKGFGSVNDIELFRPHDDMTRAECAEMLAWYLRT